MPYYFKLPDYNELTPKQRSAITKEGAIALSGGPGTGKSVVSVWRHITNYQDDIRRSLILTYTKSLRFFLMKSVESKVNSEENISKRIKIQKAAAAFGQAHSWHGCMYDEIIIDEAQDLPENEIVTLVNDLNPEDIIKKQINTFEPSLLAGQTSVFIHGVKYNILRSERGNIRYISKFAKFISYGADDKQILYPEKCTSESRLREIFSLNSHLPLFQNFRNTYEILIFVRTILTIDVSQTTLDRMLEDNRTGPKPVLKLVDTPENQNAAILEIIKDFNNGVNNIAILYPLIRQVRNFSDFLSNNHILHTNYTSEKHDIVEIENIHVTTFKSVKGLEFDVVIIPDFGSYRDYINNLNVVNEEDYNVAFTRAKRNLFLISQNELPISEAVLKRERFMTEHEKLIEMLNNL